MQAPKIEIPSHLPVGTQRNLRPVVLAVNEFLERAIPLECYALTAYLDNVSAEVKRALLTPAVQASAGGVSS